MPGPFGYLENQRRGDIAIHNGIDWEVLHPGTSGQFFKTLGTSARPAWATLPLPSDLSISGQAQGDIVYFNGTNWVRLAAGTLGYALRTSGAAANPVWAQLGTVALAPQVQEKVGADTNAFTTEVDVNSTALTYTPEVAGVALVDGVFDLECTGGGAAGDIAQGFLSVDAADRTGAAIFQLDAATGRLTLSQTWLVAVTAASHTFKLRVKRITGAGTWNCHGLHTRMRVLTLANTNAATDAND